MTKEVTHVHQDQVLPQDKMILITEKSMASAISGHCNISGLCVIGGGSLHGCLQNPKSFREAPPPSERG